MNTAFIDLNIPSLVIMQLIIFLGYYSVLLAILADLCLNKNFHDRVQGYISSKSLELLDFLYSSVVDIL